MKILLKQPVRFLGESHPGLLQSDQLLQNSINQCLHILCLECLLIGPETIKQTVGLI